MAKKQFFCIIDTETTDDNQVFDFAAIIVDRKGVIHNKCAIILRENIGKDLYYDPTGKSIWSKEYAAQKKNNYMEMLNNGSRMMASVSAVNRWLAQAIGKYNPTLTAYNLAFDREKCRNTGIDLTGFADSFCLWHCAANMFAGRKDFKQFILENHYFGNVTEKGNCTYKTNAEIMAHYVTGNKEEEPHTALEDAQYFELPILVKCVNKSGWREYTQNGYNWRNYQMRDNFTAK